MKEGLLYCNMVLYLHILLSWLLSVSLHMYVDISKYYCCTSYNTIKLSSFSNKSWSKWYTGIKDFPKIWLKFLIISLQKVLWNKGKLEYFGRFQSEYTSPFQLHDYRFRACSLSWCNVRSFPRFVAQRYNHFSSTRKWANIIKKAIQYCKMFPFL